MKENEKFVGKTKIHPQLGRVIVDKPHGKTRTMVEVTVIDRGKGYDEIQDKYVGVRTKGGWYRGENKQYGHKDVVHIKNLK